MYFRQSSLIKLLNYIITCLCIVTLSIGPNFIAADKAIVDANFPNSIELQAKIEWKEDSVNNEKLIRSNDYTQSSYQQNLTSGNLMSYHVDASGNHQAIFHKRDQQNQEVTFEDSEPAQSKIDKILHAIEKLKVSRRNTNLRRKATEGLLEELREVYSTNDYSRAAWMLGINRNEINENKLLKIIRNYENDIEKFKQEENEQNKDIQSLMDQSAKLKMQSSTNPSNPRYAPPSILDEKFISNMDTGNINEPKSQISPSQLHSVKRLTPTNNTGKERPRITSKSDIQTATVWPSKSLPTIDNSKNSNSPINTPLPTSTFNAVTTKTPSPSPFYNTEQKISTETTLTPTSTDKSIPTSIILSQPSKKPTENTPFSKTSLPTSTLEPNPIPNHETDQQQRKFSTTTSAFTAPKSQIVSSSTPAMPTQTEEPRPQYVTNSKPQVNEGGEINFAVTVDNPYRYSTQNFHTNKPWVSNILGGLAGIIGSLASGVMVAAKTAIVSGASGAAGVSGEIAGDIATNAGTTAETSAENIELAENPSMNSAKEATTQTETSLSGQTTEEVVQGSENTGVEAAASAEENVNASIGTRIINYFKGIGWRGILIHMGIILVTDGIVQGLYYLIPYIYYLIHKNDSEGLPLENEKLEQVNKYLDDFQKALPNNTVPIKDPPLRVREDGEIDHMNKSWNNLNTPTQAFPNHQFPNNQANPSQMPSYIPQFPNEQIPSRPPQPDDSIYHPAHPYDAPASPSRPNEKPYNGPPRPDDIYPSPRSGQYGQKGSDTTSVHNSQSPSRSSSRTSSQESGFYSNPSLGTDYGKLDASYNSNSRNNDPGKFDPSEFDFSKFDSSETNIRRLKRDLKIGSLDETSVFLMKTMPPKR